MRSEGGEGGGVKITWSLTQWCLIGGVIVTSGLTRGNRTGRKLGSRKIIMKW